MMMLACTAIDCSFLSMKVFCEVNGHRVAALIDTGADVSIISSRCAKDCGISDSIDTTQTGSVTGVGSGQIVGKIDNLKLKIGPVSFQNKISILNNANCDLILGTDLLERLKTKICFKDSQISFNINDRQIKIPVIPKDSARIYTASTVASTKFERNAVHIPPRSREVQPLQSHLNQQTQFEDDLDSYDSYDDDYLVYGESITSSSSIESTTKNSPKRSPWERVDMTGV
jgi:predicted aspartyl protease